MQAMSAAAAHFLSFLMLYDNDYNLEGNCWAFQKTHGQLEIGFRYRNYYIECIGISVNNYCFCFFPNFYSQFCIVFMLQILFEFFSIKKQNLMAGYIHNEREVRLWSCKERGHEHSWNETMTMHGRRPRSLLSLWSCL